MSQVPTSACPKCYTVVNPGQPFCPNCGTSLAGIGSSVPPTMAASSGSWQPPTPSSPSNGGIPPTMAAMPGSSPSSGGYDAAPPPPVGLPNSSYGSPSGYPSPSYDPYGGSSGPSMPPPPPTDPYAASSQANPYGPPPITPTPLSQPGQYMPYAPPTKKKAPMLYIVIGIVVAVLVVCGGGTWALTQALNTTSKTGGTGGGGITGGGGGQFASEQKINLSMVYSSVKFDFTSLQQADKFDDDSYTISSYKKKNYVRINFKEQQTAAKSSYFSYSSAFKLVLPDKSTVAGLKASEYSGPEQGVSRANWVDFELNNQVDLSKLSLTLGTSSEAQMTFELKTGANVSKYQPLVANYNKSFQYAGMNWVHKSSTQVYYTNGKQAKSGKVFILVDLVASNPDGNGKVYLYSGFMRLKSGDTVTAPTYDSNMDDFDIIDEGTSNVKGTAVFETPPSDSYVLEFKSGENISAYTITFSIGSGS